MAGPRVRRMSLPTRLEVSSGRRLVAAPRGFFSDAVGQGEVSVTRVHEDRRDLFLAGRDSACEAYRENATLSHSLGDGDRPAISSPAFVGV